MQILLINSLWQQQTSSIGSYTNDTGSNYSDGSDSLHQQQTRYSGNQLYSRQQSGYQSNSLPRDQGSRSRNNAWPPSGGRNDKHRSGDNMSSGHNSHQHDEDLYTPLDSNGELSNRSLSSNQRPSEGNTLIYAVRIDVWLFVEVTLSVYMYAQNLNIYH